MLTAALIAAHNAGQRKRRKEVVRKRERAGAAIVL